MVLFPPVPVEIPDETIEMRESVRKLIELDPKMMSGVMIMMMETLSWKQWRLFIDK